MNTDNKDANVPKIEYINIDQIDENPDNKEIFNMEDIRTLARSIEYYISNVLTPEGFKGDVNKQSAEFFNISTSSVYKYRQIVKMIPELQVLANDPQFPYSGFVSAHRLSEEKQHELYNEIKDYSKTHLDEDGNPIEISRQYIEQTVRRLLNLPMPMIHRTGQKPHCL